MRQKIRDSNRAQLAEFSSKGEYDSKDLNSRASAVAGGGPTDEDEDEEGSKLQEGKGGGAGRECREWERAMRGREEQSLEVRRWGLRGD